jgi:hypothetical protein
VVKWAAWITLERDGIARRYTCYATDAAEALEVARDMANAFFPQQALTISVWEDE